MPLKVKRQFPYTEREFSGRIPLDDKFDVADKKMREARKQMTTIAGESIVHSARKLLAAARLFDPSDPSVKALVVGLSSFASDKDLGSLASSLRDFHQKNPINQFTNGTPEHSLVYACYLLANACLSMVDHDPEAAYRSTVSSRFALRFVGE